MSDSKQGGAGGRRAARDADDEFDYGDSAPPASRPGGAAGAGQQSAVVRNQAYDEAVDLDGDDSMDDSIDTHAHAQSQSATSPPAKGAGGGGGGARGGRPAPVSDSPPAGAMDHLGRGGHGEYASDVEIPGFKAGSGGGGAAPSPSSGADMSSGPAPSPALQAGGGGVGGGQATGAPGMAPPGGSTANPGVSGVPPRKAAYSAADFAASGVKVPDEVRELFEYIARYKPHAVELDTKLKCFIPDYIPAVGEIDPFLKPLPPDGREDDLGLKQLDEPSASQSDPTVLDLQLRALSKKSGLEPQLVRSIEHADKNPKDVAKWIASIADLHRSKPGPQVHYAKPMPDIERLMQEWPPEFEELLKTVPLPGPDLDLSLDDYARVVCGILDIPVYGASVVPSLHVLFTLYNEFKSNQHFMNLGASQQQGGGGGGATARTGGGARSGLSDEGGGGGASERKDF